MPPAAPPIPADDGFDFRGVEWLGRERDISTAVSARAFRDVRNAPPSRARAEYLGFGQNEPARGFYLPAHAGGTRGADAMQPGCSWSLSVWNRPISAKELVTAGNALAGGRAGEAEIVTGAAVHRHRHHRPRRSRRLSHPPFRHARPGDAAPRPNARPRPALLTSFGGEGSDGLLELRRDLRPSPRRRSRHPLRLRHGERRRRWRRARRRA